MMYYYGEHKKEIFTENGQRLFLAIRDKCRDILSKSGAITMGKAISDQTGLNWTMLACVDRLVELGELREIEQVESVASQNRIFVEAKK